MKRVWRTLLIGLINTMKGTRLEFRNGYVYKKGTSTLYTGKSTSKYKNGNIHTNGAYKNGEKDGEWITYFENGKLL